MEIKIKYTGKYPSLCMGKLTVIIDNKKWKFPDNCLSYGGTIDLIDIDYIEWNGWLVDEWPEDFPENLKKKVIKTINKELPKGCCGGCERRKKK